MTQNTDQERAEFEAWSQANNKYHVSGYNPHNDLWEAWQAARSAPATPVPQGWKLVPVEPTQEVLDAIDLMADDHRAFDDSGAFWNYLLAAAPQPPEPAQLDDTNVADTPQVFDLKGGA